MRFEVICQVDDDATRCAALAHLAEQNRWRLAAFADVLDRPTEGLAAALVHDEGCAVAQTVAQAARSGVAVIGYSAQIAAERVVEALHAGAVDYLAWPVDGTHLEERLQLAAARSARALRETLRTREVQREMTRLSKREREVLLALTRGSSNKVIARELGISHRTVEIHRANMRHKIGAERSLDAVVLALRAGMVSELPD